MIKTSGVCCVCRQLKPRRPVALRPMEINSLVPRFLQPGRSRASGFSGSIIHWEMAKGGHLYIEGDPAVPEAILFVSVESRYAAEIEIGVLYKV